MPQKREKGKIDRGEWQKIVARYENGETIAQIGRDYSCTAPAIRYIIRRSGSLRRHGPPRERAWLPAATKTSGPERHQSFNGAPNDDAGGQVRPVQATVPLRPAGGSAFGSEVRKRVTGEVATFLVRLDQASANDAASLNALQDATDGLMRATARIRIELEQLLTSEAGGEDDGNGTGPDRRSALRA